MKIFRRNNLESIWRRKCRVEAILRRLREILANLDEDGHYNSQDAFSVRYAIMEANNAKRSIEAELNLN
jgi:hypothetical protein